jgi:hypothetical protein
MQRDDLVARRLSMLATLFVMPGGLFILCAIACVLLLMRSDSGRRALATLKDRIPARVKAPLRRVLLLARGEQVFLPRSSQVL